MFDFKNIEIDSLIMLKVKDLSVFYLFKKGNKGISMLLMAKKDERTFNFTGLIIEESKCSVLKI